MLSTDAFVTLGAGIVLGGSVVIGWRYTWGSWHELRRDWRDFRTAAANARANRQERAAFACDKSCGRCHIRLNANRLYRAVRTNHNAPPTSRWVYRCRCGESTLFDVNGDAHPLKPASAA